MTTSELIKALEKMPPDAKVCFSTEDQEGLVEIVGSLEELEITWSDNFGSWQMDHGAGKTKAVWLG